MIVTGPNTYKYYKIGDRETFVPDHTQVNNKDRQLTTNYSCHSWMLDSGRLVLCTENGEIMLLENSGEYLTFI